MDEPAPTTDQQPDLDTGTATVTEAATVADDTADDVVMESDPASPETADGPTEETPASWDEVPGEVQADAEPIQADEIVASEPVPAEAPAGESPVADGPAEQLSLEEMVASLKEDELPTAQPDSDVVKPDEVVTMTPAAVVADDATIPETGLARDRLAARLPFGIYVAVWAVFVGAMTYLLWPAAVGPFTGTRFYAYFVLGGAALTAVGPLLGLGVWLAVRGRSGDGEDVGVARASFMRAAVATLSGDLLWWVGLVLLDLHRTGVLG